MKRQINVINQFGANVFTCLNWFLSASSGTSREVSFSEVLSSQTPNTKEKVAERWAYLKNEYINKQDQLEEKEIIKGFSVIIATGLLFCAIIYAGVILFN